MSTTPRSVRPAPGQGRPCIRQGPRAQGVQAWGGWGLDPARLLSQLPTGQLDKMKSPFEWDIVTRGLVAMTVEGFVGFLLTIMCQYNFLRQPQ